MTEFALPGRALADAAAWAARLIPSRPTTPVLGGVVLDAVALDQADADAPSGQVTLSVFDFDAAGTVTLGADVAEPGRILVSGNLLAAVTATLGVRDTARLAHQARDGNNPSDTTLTLDVGKGAGWELPTLDHRDYPRLPDPPQRVTTLAADDLADALGRVLPAAGNDPATPATAGVYLSAEESGPLVLAVTDRYRLAYVEVERDGSEVIGEMLVPSALAKHMATAARATGGMVDLLASDSRAGLGGGRHLVSGSLLADAIPWRRILLDEQSASGGRWLVDTEALRTAVARAATVLGAGESLTLTLTADGLAVIPTLGGKGRASHRCEAAGADQDDEAQIGVSGAKLHDALAFCGSAPMIEVRTVPKAWHPILVRPADENGDVLPGARHVLAQQRQAVSRDEAA